MRIGISPGNFVRFGEERYQVLKAAGFTCVDYGMADTETGFYLLQGEALEEAIAHERALAEAAGMQFSQVHGPWRWPAQDATLKDREERLEKMIRSIRMTAALGCKYWVVHPVMPFGIEEAEQHELAAQTREINLAFMRQLLDVARENDVVICLENMPMPRFSLGSPQAILDFVREIDDDHFQICLDTGHVAVFPSLRVGDEVRRLGKMIKVLHIHDNSGRGDEHLPPRRGIIAWEDFVLALRQIGFDGVFSQEPAYSADATCDEQKAFYAELSALASQLLQQE